MGRLSRLNRVWAVGRETYARFYPNPGVGLKLYGTPYRIALSLYGGFEVFKFVGRPIVWRRTWSFLSRVKRPGGVK